MRHMDDQMNNMMKGFGGFGGEDPFADDPFFSRGNGMFDRADKMMENMRR